jgi:hypothetical protein
MINYDSSKFVFTEVFNNADGKTSGSGFIGVIIGLVGAVGIIVGIVGYFMGLPDTLAYFGVMLKVLAASAALLGVRKLSQDFNIKKIADANAEMAQTAITVNLANVAAADVANAKAAAKNKTDKVENDKPVEGKI